MCFGVGSWGIREIRCWRVAAVAGLWIWPRSPSAFRPPQSPTTPLYTVILLKPKVSVSSITPVRETHSIALYRNLSRLNSYNVKRLCVSFRRCSQNDTAVNRKCKRTAAYLRHLWKASKMRLSIFTNIFTLATLPRWGEVTARLKTQR